MASGDTLIVFPILSAQPPASNPAIRVLRNQRWVARFDDTTNETLHFSSILPRHYAGGGITVYLHYCMQTATSGDVDWDVAFERIGDQQLDIDSDSFATVNSVDNTTVPGTLGLIDIVSIAFTDGADMDSITVGEAFRMLVTRDGASDTASGDAELFMIELKET